jgi:hypothetical protein
MIPSPDSPGGYQALMTANLIWLRAATEAIEVASFCARESADPFIENLR